MRNVVGRALRSNQQLTYVLVGAVGGMLGASLAEAVARPESDHATLLGNVVATGVYCAAFAGVLGVALLFAGEWYQRRGLSPKRTAAALLLSTAAGFLAGALAEYLYGLDTGSVAVKMYALRIAAWALMGALLGAMLSRSVPNLGVTRGAVAGALGGATGSIGFLLTGLFAPGFIGRFVGITLLGLALGFAMYLVENLSREASVEVEWAPYETSLVGLGATPVLIGGGGGEHIFKKGLPPQVSSLVFKNGQVEHIETSTGKRTVLQDGSRLRIGPLHMTIHASAGSDNAAGVFGDARKMAIAALGAVVVFAAALTMMGPLPKTGADGKSSAGRLTTLGHPGETAVLDTSKPITEVNVRLQWHAAVDLDLVAGYRLKSGETGIVDYERRSGPHISLDHDAGVGSKAGDNEEDIRIDSLNDFKAIIFCARIWGDDKKTPMKNSFAAYDSAVSVTTNSGDSINVPLTSGESEDAIVVEKYFIDNGSAKIENINRASSFAGMVDYMNRELPAAFRIVKAGPKR